MVGKQWTVINKAGEYGHTPQIEKTLPVTEDIYVQVLDEINLNAIILAVNNLP